MRSHFVLLLGSIAATACGSVAGQTGPTSDASIDPSDALLSNTDAPPCVGVSPQTITTKLTAADACTKLQTAYRVNVSPGRVGFMEPKGADNYSCSFDPNYSAAVYEASSDGADGGGGTTKDAGQKADGGIPCPAYGAEVTLTCTGGGHPCGRPFEGYVDAMVPKTTQDFFASCMRMEAASVVAFALLEEELRELGAPSELLAECRAAARDEERHAAQMAELASAIPPKLTSHRRKRSVLEIALENARVGMVRETYGAVVARAQATRAADPRVRAALDAISSDEMGHAELSWKVAKFLETKLTAKERRIVKSALADEVSALTRELEDEPPVALVRECGLPDARLAADLMSMLRERIWSPLGAQDAI